MMLFMTTMLVSRKPEQAHLLAAGERRQACRSRSNKGGEICGLVTLLNQLPDVVEQRQVTYFRKGLL